MGEARGGAMPKTVAEGVRREVVIPAAIQRGWGPLAVGHGAALAGWRIVAVASVRSAPIERLMRQAAEEGRLLDLSFGRRVRSVVVLDSGHVAKLAITPETALARWRGAEE